MIHLTATIHPEALVEKGAVIGSRTRVWAFAHVLSGAQIGEDCNICDHSFIESNVRIGNRVTIKSGVYIWDGIDVEDDVFIGPCVALTNDKHPRSKQYLDHFEKTVLKQGCTLGANATILPGITVGRWAMVGAASVVTHDVPDYAVVYGNPAKPRGWACSCGILFTLANGSRFECQCSRKYQHKIKDNTVREINI